MSFRTLLSGMSLLAAAPALATATDLRSVAAMQDHDRVLLVFSPSPKDARLTAQRGEMARAGLEASERDLVLVVVTGDAVLGARDAADALRRRYKVAPYAYRTILLGKDGNAALTVDGPVPAARVMHAIDAMPMRQAEMRRARAGLGAPAH